MLALEAELGLGLKGSRASLAERLGQMLSGAGALKGGSSFPTDPTPVAGQLFWRDDLRQLFIFDGAAGQWQRIDSTNDHGRLGGLGDDDHPQYLLASGARELAGNLTVQQNLRFRSGTSFLGTIDHSISTARTWVLPDESGQLVVASLPIPVAKGGTGLVKHPACELSRASNQAIPNNAWASVIWDVEAYDTDALFDTSAGTGVITIRTPGLYAITAQTEFASNSTGIRGLSLVPNVGKGAWVESGASSNPSGRMNITLRRKFAVGDTVSVQVIQTSGASLNLLATVYTWVTVTYEGPGE